MNGDLQARINPVTSAPVFDMNTKKATTPNTGDGAPGSSEIDFLSLMQESTTSVKQERDAKKNGDLSSAKSYEDFLDKIADQTKPRRDPKNQLNKDDFLKLFVTQLQNQDPLNPDDGAEMASKLAQFNGLEQMMNVNKTLEKMVDQQNSARDIELINYIGKEVSVEGGRVHLKNGQITESQIDIKSPSSETKLIVRDGSGTVVYEKALGNVPEGKHALQWDGLTKDGAHAPNGVYTFAVEAKGINNEALAVGITSKATITGVDMKSKDGALYTNLGALKMEDVKAVGVANFDAGLPTKKPAVPAVPAVPAMLPGNPLDEKPGAAAAAAATDQGQPPAVKVPPVAAATQNPQAPVPPVNTFEDIRAANRHAGQMDEAEDMRQASIGPKKDTAAAIVDKKHLNEPEPFAERQLPE